ncbi:MAG TPA: FtsX-like permease family protein, partial [Acidimicrobiia bacterium]|nr:FtsX-like permease family protein [Acidimicrobiia bacterium]
MWKLTIKNVLARKVRFLLTGVAVMLGVAFVSGTLVLTATISHTFDNLFSTIYQNTDAVVRQQAAFGSGFQTQRGRIDASLVPVVRSAPGVQAADGTVQGYAQIINKSNKTVGKAGQGPPALGVSWLPDRQLSTFHIVDGRGPKAANEIVIDEKSAKDAGYRVGDQVPVVTKTGRAPYVLVGTVGFGKASSLLGATVVGFTPDTASRVLGEPGKVDAIDVKADSGVSQAQVVRNIERTLKDKGLDKNVEVLTGKQITAENQSNVKQGLSFFNTFLLIFGVVALLVGSFIIFNTFSIIVAQRTREMALLRAIGAVRKQVVGGVLFESVLVGIVASTIGFVGGIALAGGLKGLLAALGIDIPAGGIVVPASAVIWAYVTGLVVTVIAAVAPALRASRIPPVAAMRDVAIDRSSTSPVRILSGGVVTAIGIAMLLGGLFGSQIALVGVGAAVIFLGVAILGPVLARPIVSALGVPVRAMRGVTGQLARDNATRNPKRTSATAAALMIGVALVVFITIFGASIRSSVNAAIDQSMKADYVVTSQGFGQGQLPLTLENQLKTVSGVKSVSGVRTGEVKINGSVKMLIAVDPQQVNSLFDLLVSKGNITDLGTDGIAIQKTTASDNNWKLGDQVRVQFAQTGSKTLRVAAIFDQTGVGNYVVSNATYAANFPDQFNSQIYIRTEGGPNAQVRQGLEQVVKQYPAGKLQDRAEFKHSQGDQVNQFLNLVYVLLMFAIVIAVFGIANTIGLSVIERTREVGLLRAVGMSRRQLRSTIRWESVLVALLGAVLGLVVGIFFGWAMVTALSDQGINKLAFAPVSLVVIVVIAGIFGVLAGALPARRAARLDVLRAVTTE